MGLTRSRLSKSRDDALRSKQGWERGRGAPRKGNPRYTPVNRTGVDGVKRKLYILRRGK